MNLIAKLMTPNMNTIRRLIQNWNTSGTNSNHDPEFVSFKRKFKSALVNELKSRGVDPKTIQFNYGHYYISGFFTTPSGQIYYFSISDVRHFFDIQLLYRTAQHYKDWRGGCNQYVEIENGMAARMSLL